MKRKKYLQILGLVILIFFFPWLSANAQDDCYEDNDSAYTAYDISLDEQTWLSSLGCTPIAVGGDEDWYMIEVTSGFNEVIIDVTFSHSGGDIDIYLADSSMNLLAYSVSTSDNEHIDYVVPSAGIYYIVVVNLDNTSNPYDLWWDDVSPSSGPICGDGLCDTSNGEDDVNCPQDCGCQASGCDVQAPAGCWCDADCVSLGDCCADACSVCGYCGGGPSCGNGVCEAGEDENNCPQDCTVCGNGICGPYEDSASCPQDCGGGGSDDCYEENDSAYTAYDISLDEQTWLSSLGCTPIAVGGDEDWYMIEVTSGFNEVIIDVTFSHSGGDIDIALFDSSGNLLDISDSVDDNEHIDCIVPGAGIYYIGVVNLDNTSNPYDLWWDDVSSGGGGGEDEDEEEDDDEGGDSCGCMISGNSIGQVSVSGLIYAIPLLVGIYFRRKTKKAKEKK